MSGNDDAARDDTARDETRKGGGCAKGPESLGRTAYHAYGDDAGWLNFRGDSMPTWDELPEKTRAAWRASARAVAVAVGEAVKAAACQVVDV